MGIRSAMKLPSIVAIPLMLKCCLRLQGGKVLMLNRASGRTAKAEAAVKHVAAAEANVTSVVCDLADFSSVRQAAAAVIQSCPNGINILCNNAGVLACPDEATVDGYDLQVQVNHLSHFLLTRELMPLLEARTAMDGDARIIHHSSIARSWPPTPLKAVYLQKNGGNLGGDWHGLMNDGPRFERYHQSKLANAGATFRSSGAW